MYLKNTKVANSTSRTFITQPTVCIMFSNQCKNYAHTIKIQVCLNVCICEHDIVNLTGLNLFCPMSWLSRSKGFEKPRQDLLRVMSITTATGATSLERSFSLLRTQLGVLMVPALLVLESLKVFLQGSTVTAQFCCDILSGCDAVLFCNSLFNQTVKTMFLHPPHIVQFN